ncbi:MAG: CBS domain-containing protein, partial [Bacteroidales bacterium]|nr:CBS domain-containing protein [Bacteroidales bacterium]
NKSDVTLGDIKRDIPAFPEETTLDIIWDEMISKDEPISVIINEYGAFQGILTLEDVIETILGNEIVDERDEVRDMQQLALERYRKRTQGSNS